MDLKPLSYYARELRGDFAPELFRPVPSRLAWLALHVGLVVAGTVGIVHGWGGLPGALAFALLIGHSFAGMAFVGHELMHGAVVRSSRLRLVLGWLCFVPFTLSPRLWVAWHNRVHHGHTMEVGVDPDAYPTLEQYRASRQTRIADFVAIGRRRIIGLSTLLFGFTGQSKQIMWGMARRLGYLTPSEHNWAIAETVAGVALWTAVGFLIGGHAFFFAFVVPLLIGNAVVISYILTNHSLSPMTPVNDPLVNSLSVTAPKIVEKLHLNFGLHVEHHLFPAMSSAFAPKVRERLLARWPERYQSLPLMTALWQLFSTPRVYKNATTLVDPATGREFSTILPGPRPPVRMPPPDDDAPMLVSSASG